MREDMFKVIVERPRHGVRGAKRIKLRHEKTGLSQIGMKRQAKLQQGCKSLNENLVPLKRFLWKQCGRKWNDVYSEICASLDTGSTVKMHVRDHLDDFVERGISIDRDGNWVTSSRYGCELYVDPIDGILKELDGLRKRLGLKKVRYGGNGPRLVENRVKLSSDHELRKINGDWFNVQFSDEWFVERPSRECLEVPHKDYDCRWWYTRLPNEWRAVRSKLQLGKKELKKYKLKGGVNEH